VAQIIYSKEIRAIPEKNKSVKSYSNRVGDRSSAQRVSMQKLDLSENGWNDDEDYKSSRQSYARVPLVCLDVKISEEYTEQLLVFEDDDIRLITDRFAQKHCNSIPFTHIRIKLCEEEQTARNNYQTEGLNASINEKLIVSVNKQNLL